MGKLSPKELIMKANLAIDKLKKDMEAVLVEDYNERPENTKFIAARALTSGNTNLALAVFSCLWESLIVFAKDWLHVWA